MENGKLGIMITLAAHILHSASKGNHNSQFSILNSQLKISQTYGISKREEKRGQKMSLR